MLPPKPTAQTLLASTPHRPKRSLVVLLVLAVHAVPFHLRILSEVGRGALMSEAKLWLLGRPCGARLSVEKRGADDAMGTTTDKIREERSRWRCGRRFIPAQPDAGPKRSVASIRDGCATSSDRQKPVH